MSTFILLLSALGLTAALLLAAPLTAGEPAGGTLPAFELAASYLEETRLAQPQTPFVLAGRRFAMIGTEGGSFEAWAYPIKVLRDFQLSFLLGDSTRPIPGSEIVRFVTAVPPVRVLTFTHQAFTVRAIYAVAPDEPAAVVYLDVRSSEPLTIIGGFLPALQPMWPAGLGGQYAFWNADLAAYVLSESSRRHHALVGSPLGRGISSTPAHMLAETPHEMRIDLPDPGRVRDRLIPILVTAGRGERDAVVARYQQLVADPERVYRAALEHDRELDESTVRIRTPSSELDQAFGWAKIALDSLVVDNPDLGRGLVAGLGPSGAGGRPGFGWFFGGDASINSLSLNRIGAYAPVRDALTFQRRYQRDDGKIAHEISQAAAYVDWFHDFPYAYLHGDTTPYYILALHDYYQWTADAELVRASWDSLRRAYRWCRSTDANGDGLMDNAEAGLGAVEYGALTDIVTDVYLAAVGTRAALAMSELASAFGTEEERRQARADYERAVRAFDQRFWDEATQQYAYAFNAAGERVTELGPWSAVGLMWGLGDPERSRRSLVRLATAELTTDWGVRSISRQSAYFEPLNYNYGAVWPFLNGWVAAAQFRHGMGVQGYGTLRSTARHTFDHALGSIPEVFSGVHNVWPQEGVPHQGFSSSGVILPLIRGLLGLDGDGPGRRLTFAPQLPADWERVTVENVRVGEAVVRLDYRRSRDAVHLEVGAAHAKGYTLLFAPVLGAGTEVRQVTVEGVPVDFRRGDSPSMVQPVVEVVLGPEAKRVAIELEPTVEVLAPENDSRPGDPDRGLKVVAVERDGKRLRNEVEGLAGRTYLLPLANLDLVRTLSGGRRAATGVSISIPGPGDGQFKRHAIVITCR